MLLTPEVVEFTRTLILLVASTVIGAVIGTYYARRRMRAEKLHDLKRCTYMAVWKTSRDISKHIQRYYSLQAMDPSRKEPFDVIFRQLFSRMFLLGSKEAAHRIIDEIDMDTLAEILAGRAHHTQVEWMSNLKTRILVEAGFGFAEILSEALDRIGELEFIDHPDDVRSSVETVRSLIKERLDMLGAESVGESLLSSNSSSVQSSEDLEIRMYTALEEMRVAMMKDIDVTL